ncbi:hypothetical protein INR49_019228, partial [Caranx melampygus]
AVLVSVDVDRRFLAGCLFFPLLRHLFPLREPIRGGEEDELRPGTRLDVSTAGAEDLTLKHETAVEPFFSLERSATRGGVEDVNDGTRLDVQPWTSCLVLSDSTDLVLVLPAGELTDKDLVHTTQTSTCAEPGEAPRPGKTWRDVKGAGLSL